MYVFQVLCTTLDNEPGTSVNVDGTEAGTAMDTDGEHTPEVTCRTVL